VLNFDLTLGALANVKSKLYSDAALVTLRSKLITIMRRKAYAQLHASAHNKVHILTLYLLHFLTHYPISNALLPEERAGTAWELSKLENLYALTPKDSVSVPLSPDFLFSLFVLQGVRKDRSRKGGTGTISAVVVSRSGFTANRRGKVFRMQRNADFWLFKCSDRSFVKYT
jgi:hypothetical protein